MFNIGNYLARFKKLGESEGVFKENAITIFKEVLNLELRADDFSLRNGVLFLRTSPMAKNSIYIKKEKILALLKERTRRTIFDIR